MTSSETLHTSRLIAVILPIATVAFCQTGTLLILQKGGNSLGFYSPEGELITMVPVGKPPYEMVLSPDSKYASAAAEEQDTIFVVSVKDRKMVRQFKTAPGTGLHPVQLVENR